MEIFSKDLILGEFRASNYGLYVASFDNSGESEGEFNITPTTIEEYIGNQSVPKYLGQKYENKLRPKVTLVKNPCIYSDNMNFSEKEIRAILRVLTGFKGYKWMKVITDNLDEDLWYRVKVTKVNNKKVGGNIVGLIFELECDSAFAWSKENIVTINTKPNKPFYIYNNTDDLNDYIYPVVSIKSISGGTINITNITDNNWTTELSNVSINEKITLDCSNEIISSDNIAHELLLNDMNLHWFRFVPDKNEYICNSDTVITFKYRVPRKVGII